MKKEAKKEMDERMALQREESAACREDDEFKVCNPSCNVHLATPGVARDRDAVIHGNRT